MSTISKVAVYDARLVQDEPAYAVQKGALSVSVAPFQAIAASVSSMTFQVLVPSLNVFVDRKIQLSTSLNFTAQLFYGGPRATSMKGYIVGATLSGAGTSIAGTVLTLQSSVALNGAAASAILPYGTKVFSVLSTVSVAPGTIIIGSAGANSYIINISQTVASGSGAWLGLEAPLNYDVPDPSTGVQVQLTQDSGFSSVNDGEAFLPSGYATAVSAKDLSLVPFPIQSCLNNMTATLNDCTVTTNGDTLREQLMLTSTRENLKQRTTPTNQDVYAWGRDDALNGSGNFSSYSVVNGYGDLPTGSYPMQWFSDATQTSPLQTAGAVITSGTTTVFPFLPVGSVGSFNLESTGNFKASMGSGCGWYIANQASQNVVGASKNTVIVPFVQGQPVWTTGFPGGDLICAQSTVTTGTANYGAEAGFFYSNFILTLLKNVPPFSMIGARMYLTGTAASGAQPTPIAWVGSLVSGSLGQSGSTYDLISAPGAFANNQNVSLQAGFQVTSGPMPVFGAVTAVEPLVLSPLIWADSAEFQTVGLYGMTNMQFVLNFAPLGTCFAASNPAVTSITNNYLPGAGAVVSTNPYTTLPYWVDDLTRPTSNTGNIIRSSNIRSVISDLSFGSSTNQYGPWTNPTLYVGFLTPGPDVTLPLVSTVPYVEFPRYTKTVVGSGFSGSQTLSTNTISLTSIPDMIMMYVKPATKGPSQLDQYVPIQNVSVTFDNFSNLCSGFQQFNLYESAVAAGLDIDWHQWRGYTQAAYPSLARTSPQTEAVTIAPTYKQTAYTQLSGGPILLRMGHDITLSPGLAPGCLGNYSFQANLTTHNPYQYFDNITSIQITVIAINTGFFETVRGQSAIRKTILNSADVEAANPDSGVTRTHLNRMIGRGGYMRGGSGFVQHVRAGMGAGQRLLGSAAVGRGGMGGMADMSEHQPSGMKRGRSSGLV